MNHYLYPLLLVLALCSSTAHAVQFRLLGWSSPDVHLLCDLQRKPVELNVLTNGLSEVYTHNEDGPIVFYKFVEHEGKRIKQVACTIPVPPEIKQGVIVLIPGDESKILSRKVYPNSVGYLTADAPLVYNYAWIDDSSEARPPGTIEFRNLTNLPIALQVEAKQIMLEPQAKAQTGLIKGAKRMAFRGAAQINGQWKIFSSNPIPTRGPSRMMVILRDGPSAKQTILQPGEPNISVVPLFDWPDAEQSQPKLVSRR